MEDLLNKLKEKAPEVVKDNKGALVGALIGYLLTDNKQAQSAILGAVAGSLVLDKTKEEEKK